MNWTIIEFEKTYTNHSLKFQCDVSNVANIYIDGEICKEQPQCYIETNSQIEGQLDSFYLKKFPNENKKWIKKRIIYKYINENSPFFLSTITEERDYPLNKESYDFNFMGKTIHHDGLIQKEWINFFSERYNKLIEK